MTTCFPTSYRFTVRLITEMCVREQKNAIVLKKQGESDILSPSFYENTVVAHMMPWLIREELHHGQAENLSSE